MTESGFTSFAANEVYVGSNPTLVFKSLYGTVLPGFQGLTPTPQPRNIGFHSPSRVMACSRSFTSPVSRDFARHVNVSTSNFILLYRQILYKNIMYCPNCDSDTDYERIGTHWTLSCEHPQFTDRQWELIAGTLMGDGTVVQNEQNKYPIFKLAMTTREFLEWFDDEMGILSTGVSLFETGSDNASRAKKTGFTTTVNEENYNDMYVCRSRTLPDLVPFREWYRSGEKRFPDRLELTPLVAKLWYCCDGYSKQTNPPVATLGVANEIDRKEYLRNLFDDAGFSITFDDKSVVLSTDESRRFFDWIGDPLPGFEYKWPV